MDKEDLENIRDYWLHTPTEQIIDDLADDDRLRDQVLMLTNDLKYMYTWEREVRSLIARLYHS